MDGRQRAPRRCCSEKIRKNAEQKPPFDLSKRGFLLINVITSIYESFFCKLLILMHDIFVKF